MITKIYIRHFRSIIEETIDCENINAFYGVNDVGKSNVLKALNLFFNRETDHGEEFDFDRDFCIFHQTAEKQAKEIIVEITVRIPDTYKIGSTKTREVIWGKSWRKDSQKEHDSWVLLNLKNRSKVSSRGKIRAWLNKIDFQYVPAIKDKSYFSSLQGSLYKTLAKASQKGIKNSTNQFEKALQGQVVGLLNNLGKIFKGKSTMKLPENFQKVFEILEFYLNGIPLSRKGDGIKILHIPEILRFMGDITNEVLNQGGIRQMNIWGFEEPENCLEEAMRLQLLEFFVDSSKNGYQIFLTTHSPVFYKKETTNIDNENYFINHVSKEIDQIKNKKAEYTKIKKEELTIRR